MCECECARMCVYTTDMCSCKFDAPGAAATPLAERAADVSGATGRGGFGIGSKTGGLGGRERGGAGGGHSDGGRHSHEGGDRQNNSSRSMHACWFDRSGDPVLYGK